MTTSAGGGPAFAAVALAIAIALGSPALAAWAEVAPPLPTTEPAPPSPDPVAPDPVTPPAEVVPDPAADTVPPGTVLPPVEEPAVDSPSAPEAVTPTPSRPRPSTPGEPAPQPSEWMPGPAGGFSSFAEEPTDGDPQESVPAVAKPAVKPNRPSAVVQTPAPTEAPAPVVAAWNVDYTSPIAGSGTPTLAVVALGGSLAVAALLAAGTWLYHTRWANRVSAGPFRRR